jgi:hypothetical protein
MRYMLGNAYNHPYLLAEVEKVTEDGFHFWVKNGAWTGKFTYSGVDVGSVFVNYTKETVEDVFILSDNQDIFGSYFEIVSRG